MEAVANADHLYEVERRVRHAERPGFRISELQISPSQSVPWHYHNKITDTFYVIDGSIKLLLRDPAEDVYLNAGDTYAVRERRPHRVENAGSASATFLVLQGIGEYDYVPFAHEVGTPLNLISGHVQLLKSDLDRDPRDAESRIRTISAQIERIERIVRRMLDKTRFETELSPLDLNVVLRKLCDAMSPAFDKRNIRLVETFTDKL